MFGTHRKFTMTREQEQRIEQATTAPVPGHAKGTWAHDEIVQRRVNAEWLALGREMGFDAKTVMPAPGGNVLSLVGRAFGFGSSRRTFLAVPKDPE